MKQKLRDNAHIIILTVSGVLWCLFLWWFSSKFLIACFVALVILELFMRCNHREIIITRIQCDYARNRCTLFSRFCRLEDVPLNAVEVRLRRALIPDELPVPMELNPENIYEGQWFGHNQGNLVVILGHCSIDFTLIYNNAALKRKQFMIQSNSYIKFLEEIQCQK